MLGLAGNGSLLVVVHTFHFQELDETSALVRIISARPATKREKRDYETSS